MQIIRFLIAGAIATGINFFIYNSIYLISGKITFASFIGYISGLFVSFIFAKIWVFKDKSKLRIVKSVVVFCLIYILGGLEMSLIIFILNQLINNHKTAWIFGALIGSLNNYLGAKYFLFKK